MEEVLGQSRATQHSTTEQFHVHSYFAEVGEVNPLGDMGIFLLQKACELQNEMEQCKNTESNRKL